MFNRLKGSAVALLCAALLTGLATSVPQVASAANERLQAVLERGVVRIGVQSRFVPWAYRAKDGSLKGIEVDLAHDVAKAMGVKLELVPIRSSNRMQFLQQGKVDLLIGAMSDRPDRCKVVGIVEPSYWASGMTLMAKKGAVSSWDDIRGKPICGKQGVFYNKIAESQFGAKVMAFTGNSEAKEAFRSGKCLAWLYDSSSIGMDLAMGEWKGYEAPVPTIRENPWGAAVPLEERGTLFGRFLSGMVYHWHESGRLIELEKKWGVPPSPWIAGMHKTHKYDRAYLGK